MTGLPPAYRPPVILELGGLKDWQSPLGFLCRSIAAPLEQVQRLRSETTKPPLRGGLPVFGRPGRTILEPIRR